MSSDNPYRIAEPAKPSEAAGAAIRPLPELQRHRCQTGRLFDLGRCHRTKTIDACEMQSLRREIQWQDGPVEHAADRDLLRRRLRNRARALARVPAHLNACRTALPATHWRFTTGGASSRIGPPAACRKSTKLAPVAQLDSASVFGTEGWGFESLRAYFFSNSNRLRHLRIGIIYAHCPIPKPDVFPPPMSAVTYQAHFATY